MQTESVEIRPADRIASYGRRKGDGTDRCCNARALMTGISGQTTELPTLRVTVHLSGMSEPLGAGWWRYIRLLERWGQLLLHELFLSRLRLPNLNDNEFVARLPSDMVKEGRRPIAGAV
jgi:hypothetical protein